MMGDQSLSKQVSGTERELAEKDGNDGTGGTVNRHNS